MHSQIDPVIQLTQEININTTGGGGGVRDQRVHRFWLNVRFPSTKDSSDGGKIRRKDFQIFSELLEILDQQMMFLQEFQMCSNVLPFFCVFFQFRAHHACLKERRSRLNRVHLWQYMPQISFGYIWHEFVCKILFISPGKLYMHHLIQDSSDYQETLMGHIQLINRVFELMSCLSENKYL